jgi:hypothetical protein
VTASEHADIARWVRTWEMAVPELQRVRDADIRSADTAGTIECTAGLFCDAVRSLPPQPTSGLVEQQFWFMKLRRP